MDFQQIMNLEDGERRAKLNEYISTAGPETNVQPLYDAWAKTYEEVSAK